MVAIYTACGDFMAMAAAPTAPKPAELASVTGRAMSHGFFGVGGTIAPVALGVIALWRSDRRTQAQSEH